MTILDATATATATASAMSLAAPAASPEELLEQFAARVAAADVDGIVALYAADAVVSLPRGREAAGHAAIRAAFAAALTAGVDLDVAQVCQPILSGSLACTSATTTAGLVRTQVARREPDGGWRWVRDGFRLREAIACLPAVQLEREEVA